MALVGTITAIRAKGRSQQRCEVLVGEQVVLEAHVEVVTSCGLHQGLSLTAERLAEAERADQVLQASRAALRQLETRGRSRAELVRALRRKRFAGEIIDTVLGRLEEAGLVDDAHLAREVAQEMGELKRLGSRAIVHKLRLMGVERGLAETAVAESTDEATELERARLTADKFLARSREPELHKRRRKLYEHLGRRGFASWLCRQVVEEKLRGDVEEEPL